MNADLTASLAKLRDRPDPFGAPGKHETPDDVFDGRPDYDPQAVHRENARAARAARESKEGSP